MWIDLTHNKIIADTVTERFVASVNENLLPLVKSTVADASGIQMYEDHIADGNLRNGVFYYPLTVIRGESPEVLWIKWSTLPKRSFVGASPFSYVGEELLEFSLADDLPPEVAGCIDGRRVYSRSDAVKLCIHTVSEDPLFLSGKYSQSFVDEMARQLTAEMSRILGVSGLPESSVELQLVFAPGTYMEHTSEAVTYRRLLLTAEGCRPRDFWVRWTRLDGALSYRISDHVDGEKIRFELGEDVPQKIREKEYRFLCSSNPSKYQSAMGKKTVTEWRDIIKRAITRGEIERVELDPVESTPEDDFEARLAEALGFVPAPEAPVAIEEDDPVAAMARAVLRRSEERAQSEAEIASDAEEQSEKLSNQDSLSVDFVPCEGLEEEKVEAVAPEAQSVASEMQPLDDFEPVSFDEPDDRSDGCREELYGADCEREDDGDALAVAEPTVLIPAMDAPVAEPIAPADRASTVPEKRVRYHVHFDTGSERTKYSEDMIVDDAPVVPSETDAERDARIRREIEAEVRRELAEDARLRAEREAERLRAESEALRAENERLAEAARIAEAERARIESEREAEAERARSEEARLRRELDAQKRQEIREKDRLTEAARLAVEEQRRLEGERAREAELASVREAERIAREAEERAAAERREEAERIRRDMENRRAAEAAKAPASSNDVGESYISRHARIIFRSAVDLNVITRIKEIVEEVLTFNRKHHVRIRMKAYPEDTTTIALDIRIPESEGELLVSIIKAIGNGRIGVTRITLE